jgi:hypothetical protein
MPNVKLGKGPAKKDNRTIKMRSLFRKAVLPPIPDQYDFDALKPVDIPLPMFANDAFGDCVIAGRAHQTLRFEFNEQKRLITIQDDDVITQYMKETGGADDGLIVLDSLKSWRNDGWMADGKHYTIHAFAQINEKDSDEVKAAIYCLGGIGVGLNLPKSASEQLDAGLPWDFSWHWNAMPGSWGGHYVYVKGYNEVGPVCVTWGKEQQMTWKFFKCYCDEAYGIVDGADKFIDSDLDVAALESQLAEIQNL